MSDSLNDAHQALLRLAAAAAAAGAVIWFVRWSQQTPLCLGASSLSEERARLKPILAELSRRFFTVCAEIAPVAKTVRNNIEAKGVKISDAALRDQLAKQCQVPEKLRTLQMEVAQQFDCKPEDVLEMQKRHAQDASIQVFSEGLTTMLVDALGGLPPVLAHVEVPAALTEDKVLEILNESQQLETQKVLDRVGGSKLQIKALGEVLTLAHKDAWEETLEAHKDELAHGKEVYHSALGLYMRREAFAERRQKLDAAHQERMVKLFRPDPQDAANRAA